MRPQLAQLPRGYVATVPSFYPPVVSTATELRAMGATPAEALENLVDQLW